jgi:hypothetical protein
MYSLLVRLMILSALFQLGLSLSDISDCRSRQCLARLEKASRRVLNVEWKAISVFPEEAKRFR